MAKKRVHEIAKDLGFQNRDLIDKLVKLGFEVKSHSSTVEEDDVRRALKKEDDERRARTDERRVSRGVIRRRAADEDGHEPGTATAPSSAAPGTHAAAEEHHEVEARAPERKVIRRERSASGVTEAPVVETKPALDAAPVTAPETTHAESAPVAAGETPPVAETPIAASAEGQPAVAAVEGEAVAAAPEGEATEDDDKKDRRDRKGEFRGKRDDEEYDEDDDKPDLLFEDVGISEQDFQVENIDRALDLKFVRVAPPPPSTKPASTLQKEEESGSKIVRTIDPNVLKARLSGAKRPEPPKDWGKEKSDIAASPLTELVVRTDASGKRKELVDVRKEAAKGGKAGRAGQRRREEMSAKDLLEHRRGQVYYPTPSRKRVKGRKGLKPRDSTPASGHKPVEIGETITVADLAKQMSMKATEIIGFLMRQGVMATINQSIAPDIAEMVALEFGYEVQSRAFDEEAHMTDMGTEAEREADPDAELRAPVVTVMGHVDHGKTTLLDRIRKSNVAAGEAGGITQRIAGYQVKTAKGSITFLDTPGHAAFSAMRARGANVTDIVILVVAADDGVMPQTIEAIQHAKQANVPIIVAVNKVDKPDASPDRVLQQLSGHGLQVEEWGGEVLSRKISAKTGDGVDDLLELIALQAEILELKANPKLPAVATVIEAEIHKGRGPVATVLVQEGTLRVGDAVVVGEAVGRVRAMIMDGGERVTEAGPSTPVEILGLDEVPNPGDDLRVAKSLDAAREIAAYRTEKRRSAELAGQTKVSLQDLLARMNDQGVKELKVIVKADVQGSVEALRAALTALSTPKVRVNVIHGGVGAVAESDVDSAKASDAIIIGFSVRPDTKALKAARSLGVEIRSHSIIYDAVDEVRLAMEGLLAPITQEKYLGRAEIRQTFSVPKVGTVAGCAVVDGVIQRSAQIRLIRDGKEIYKGKLASLKRFKDDMREVKEGLECGMGIERFNDIKVGDIIEAFEIVEVRAQLDEPSTSGGSRRDNSPPEARP